MAGLLRIAPDALRAQRASLRLGWGDFLIAHRIAARGGHPLDKVVAARRTGTGWSEIADEARVSPDAVVQDVTTVWPEAGRATESPAAAAPKEEPKGLGAKVRDLLGGAPAPSTDPT